MNQLTIIGNLTKDPELSETSSGIAFCKFPVAVNRRKTGEGEQQTDFFHVTAWRGLGETVAKYCKKGSKVCVVGRVEIKTYEANDGTKRTLVDVIAEHVEFLTSRQAQRGAEKPVLEPAFDEDDDIPF